MPGPTVFISYAREDDAHRAELCKHLRPWTYDGRLRIWDDRAIDAGADWKSEILEALDSAAVIVFMVSVDLLVSDFVHEVELPRALERRERDAALVIPVIVRACPWRATALGKLQALRGGEPVPKADPDAAWAEIAEGIAAAVAGQAAERRESEAELLVPEAANPDPPKPAPGKPPKAPAITKLSRLEELFRWIEPPIDGRVPLWREIPAGEGWIGSPEGEGHDDERPRHRVKILRPFLMAAVPVTVAQYAAFDSSRGGKGSANLPVTNVDWNRALAFCEWLGETFPWARGARLPTEEEWEYACRAGTETRYWSGDDEADLERAGWHLGNSGRRVHTVGEKPANPWGLYDVHGNVWEWTLSLWKSDYSNQKDGLEVDPAAKPADLAGGATAGGASARRVVRGGSCWDVADGARSACRNPRVPWYGRDNHGFRVLLPVTSGPELP